MTTYELGEMHFCVCNRKTGKYLSVSFEDYDDAFEYMDEMYEDDWEDDYQIEDARKTFGY